MLADPVCSAHDVEGLRCYLSTGHPGAHMSRDGTHVWVWAIDHGPVEESHNSGSVNG